MTARGSVAWVLAPLERFVGEARAQCALLLRPDGQVLGEFGFTRAVDVMGACALAAAIHASAAQLGRELAGAPFRHLHHVGRTRQIFMGEVPSAAGPVICLCVFDGESSLGLVQLYFRALREELAAAAPAPSPAPAAPIAAPDLERELQRNLAALFGRAPRPGHPSPTA